MEGHLIDGEIVSKKYRHTSQHKVKYFLYNQKGNKIDLPKEEGGSLADIPNARKVGGVCFSRLLDILGEVEYNRIYYPMPDDKANIRITMDEKKEFLKLCKRNKMLPSYVKEGWLGEDECKIVLDLTDMPISLLYMYLCTFRYIREDPGFVRALVYLVNDKGANFFSAYVLASKVCLNGAGHATLDSHNLRAYMKGEEPDNAIINTSVIIGLYMYINNPAKYDKRKVGDGEDCLFECGKTIERIAGNMKSPMLKGRSVLNPAIGCALRSGDLNKFRTVINLIKGEEEDGKNKG